MTNHGRALVIDDEESMRFFLDKCLTRLGYAVTCVNDGAAGISALTGETFALALVDLKMPKKDGMAVLAALQETKNPTPIVMMTAFGDIRTAVKAMRLGASDFITKPFDAAEIEAAVTRVMRTRELEQENTRLWELLFARGTFGSLIGRSPAMQSIYETIERISESVAPILIRGEGGTGKETVAREIVRRSNRADKPLITLNVASLPDSLLAREIFGAPRGKETGLCHQAAGGTLYLAAIDAAPISLQAQLQRLIATGEVNNPVTNEPEKVDIRIIATSRQDLAHLVRGEGFREDLYFALNVIPLEVPPLRNRREDLPLLAGFFLEKHTLKTQQPTPELPRPVLETLLAYDWPGNIRELENVLERALMLAGGGEITLDHLPPEIRTVPVQSLPPTPETPIPFREAMTLYKRFYLEQLLAHTGGNVSSAAEIAGISRPNLHRHIKESALSLDELRKPRPG